MFDEFFFQRLANEKEELIALWLTFRLPETESGVCRTSCSNATILEELKNTVDSKKNQKEIF